MRTPGHWRRARLAQAGAVRFRGRGRNINSLFLHTHYIVEKHREALLFSLLLGRFDADHSDTFDPDERADLLDFLDQAALVSESTDRKLAIRRPQRDTSSLLPVAHALGRAGLPLPSVSADLFTSLDGTAYAGLDAHSWPDYTPNAWAPGSACTIELAACFGRGFLDPERGPLSAAAVLKRVAYERPACGDCLVVAGLVNAGLQGLEAFLPAPPPSPPSSRLKSDARPPQLGGRAKLFADADLSWRTNAADWPAGPRDYCVRLVQRYSYALAAGADRLLMIVGPRGLRSKLDELTDERARFDGLAYAAINDDVVRWRASSRVKRLEISAQARPALVSKVDAVLVPWFEEQWPTSTRWELSAGE
jgi:hypothetical protein